MLKIYVHLIHLLHFGDQSLKDVFIDGDNRFGIVYAISIGNKPIHLIKVGRMGILIELTCLLLCIFCHKIGVKHERHFLDWRICSLRGNLLVGSLYDALIPSRVTKSSKLAQTEIINDLVWGSTCVWRLKIIFLIWTMILVCKILFRVYSHYLSIDIIQIISIWWLFYKVHLLLSIYIIIICNCKYARSLSLFLDGAKLWNFRHILVVHVVLKITVFYLYLNSLVLGKVRTSTLASLAFSISCWLLSKVTTIFAYVFIKIIWILFIRILLLIIWTWLSIRTLFSRTLNRDLECNSSLLFLNWRSRSYRRVIT